VSRSCDLRDETVAFRLTGGFLQMRAYRLWPQSGDLEEPVKHTSRSHEHGCAVASKQSGRAPTLLILVKDPDLRNLLASIVSGLGFAVRVGPEVNGVPDAALVHARLDDWEREAALANHSRIILLTSEPRPVVAKDLGVFCVVPMPFDLEDLESALERCLRELSAGGAQFDAG